MDISGAPVLTPRARHAHVTGERCPWCDQPIPHEKFDEIRAKIAAKERERTSAVEDALKLEFAVERAAAQSKAKTELEQARKDAASVMEKFKRAAAAKEVAVRDAAKKAAEAAAAVKVADLLKEKKAAEDQVRSLKATHEIKVKQRLQEQREALEQAKTVAVNGEKSKAYNEKLKLEGKLQELQRQLQKRTADELGEGAEVDLFESLKSEFRNDLIKRVGKGVAGADIIHEVIHNGKVCGHIVYDSKNRNGWRNDYVTKLREDQLAAKAEHAILSTPVFPSGAKQLHLQEGVIVTNPARVVVLVNMLRKHLVQVHSLRVSNQARQQKTALLYDFINSERCVQLFNRIETLTSDILELDVKEVKSHEVTWKRRGELVRSVQRSHNEFSSEIDRIIGTGSDS